jgi:putative transposase
MIRRARGRVTPATAPTPKTLLTEVGPVPVEVPRDRAGTFTPTLVPKGERRLGGLSDIIISLYAGGMTVRDICHHLQRVDGTEVSPDTISVVTDSVLDEVKARQTRPLDEIYPIIYVDALMVKVRDGNQVRNKAHLVVGVDTDGVKHILGIWLQNTEGAKVWMAVFSELRNRGVRRVLIACCDGLEGLPDAIETIWPYAIVQTSSVHNVRAEMISVVTRTVPGRTCADASPSRSRCRPVRLGRWRASHLPAGAALRAPR